MEKNFADKKLNRLDTNGKKVANKNKHVGELKALFMASIPFIGFLIFTLFPMGLSFVVSFTNLHSYDLKTMEFVGFDNLFKNYRLVLESEETRLSLRNSLIYCLSVPLNLGVSLFLAQISTRGVKGSNLFRVIMFVPTVCIGTAVAFMWQWILSDKYGVLNQIIIALGGENVGFMSTKELFMPSVILISLWKNGTNIIIMLAALSSVDLSLQEAAKVDGAKDITIFWKIIFPSILPTIFYLLIMNFVSAMQEQAIMQLLSNGGTGPGFAALTLSYQVYRLSFVGGITYGLGVGCALSWITAIFIMLIVKLLFFIQDKILGVEND